MALNYEYVNTVVGNPRYGQVYAVTSHPGGGYEHHYQDGAVEVVSSPGGTLAADWHPPQQTVVAGAAATAALAAGQGTTATTIVEPPNGTPAPKSVQGSPNPVGQAAAAAGVPYDTYVAEQDTVRNPTSQAAAAAGVSYDTYKAEQDTVRNPASQAAAAAGIPAGGTSSPSGASTSVQVLHEPPGKMEVTAGMTFWQLEQRHGWAPGTLEQLNPGVNPKDLQVGSYISIPTGNPSSPAGQTGGAAAPVATDAAQVGPASSVYQPDKAKALEADVRSKIEGWASTGVSDPPDPAKNVIDAVAKPTDTNPLNINKPHSA